MSIRTWFALVFCMVLAGSGCRRQEAQVPVMPGASYRLVDPYQDLIACLDGPHRTLYVLPEQRENVLTLLHASGSGDRFILEAAMNVYRHEVPIAFRVKEASLDQLISIDRFFDEVKALLDFRNVLDTNFGFPRWYDSNWWHDPSLWKFDSLRYRLPGDLFDSTSKDGVCYKVYQNAHCENITPARYTDCEEEISFADLLDSTRRTPIKPKHIRRRYYAVNKCLKGSSSCVEFLGVSVLTEYYSNDQCSGNPIDVVRSGYDFSCP